MRKTILINDLKERVNKTLAIQKLSQDEKRALSNMLESILFDTGNYKGFS